MFVSLLTFYRKGALFSIPFGFYWIINTPVKELFPTNIQDKILNYPSNYISQLIEEVENKVKEKY
ncbi:hypothetical protein C1N77_09740 [Geobacillus thermoleovorans]